MISPVKWSVMRIYRKDDIDYGDIEVDDGSNYGDDDKINDYGTEWGYSIL